MKIKGKTKLIIANIKQFLSFNNIEFYALFPPADYYIKVPTHWHDIVADFVTCRKRFSVNKTLANFLWGKTISDPF